MRIDVVDVAKDKTSPSQKWWDPSNKWRVNAAGRTDTSPSPRSSDSDHWSEQELGPHNSRSPEIDLNLPPPPEGSEGSESSHAYPGQSSIPMDPGPSSRPVDPGPSSVRVGPGTSSVHAQWQSGSASTDDSHPSLVGQSSLLHGNWHLDLNNPPPSESTGSSESYSSSDESYHSSSASSSQHPSSHSMDSASSSDVTLSPSAWYEMSVYEYPASLPSEGSPPPHNSPPPGNADQVGPSWAHENMDIDSNINPPLSVGPTGHSDQAGPSWAHSGEFHSLSTPSHDSLLAGPSEPAHNSYPSPDYSPPSTPPSAHNSHLSSSPDYSVSTDYSPPPSTPPSAHNSHLSSSPDYSVSTDYSPPSTPPSAHNSHLSSSPDHSVPTDYSPPSTPSEAHGNMDIDPNVLPLSDAGPSTGPHPQSSPEPLQHESEKLLSELFKGKFKRRISGSHSVNAA